MIEYRIPNNTMVIAYIPPKVAITDMVNQITKALRKFSYIAPNKRTIEQFILRTIKNRLSSLMACAKCHPEDKFSEQVGKDIAKQRLLENYHRMQDFIFDRILNFKY